MKFTLFLLTLAGNGNWESQKKQDDASDIPLDSQNVRELLA